MLSHCEGCLSPVMSCTLFLSALVKTLCQRFHICEQKIAHQKSRNLNNELKVSQGLTQSLLSHIHNNANIGFQLKLDEALVQGSGKNVRYLF